MREGLGSKPAPGPQLQQEPGGYFQGLSISARARCPGLAPRGPCVWRLCHHVPSRRSVRGTRGLGFQLLGGGTGESPGEKKGSTFCRAVAYMASKATQSFASQVLTCPLLGNLVPISTHLHYI